MPYTLPSHKVKKGETLTGIAKKYGHKQWKTIWNAPENKKIVKSRSKPELIRPGDALAIPLNEKQRKEVEAQLKLLHETRQMEFQLQETLIAEEGRLEEKQRHYEQLIRTEVESTQKIVDELNDCLKGMNKWATGVDAAAMLARMGVSLGKVAHSGYKASSATGKALKELNAKAAKDASKLVKGPITKGASKAVGTLKEDDSAALAVVGIVADSFDKMTSPSFWAHTYVQMTENGKSWSDAVTTEIGDDIKKRIKEVVADSANRIKEINKLQAEATKRSSEIGTELAESKKRVVENEAAVDVLPSL